MRLQIPAGIVITAAGLIVLATALGVWAALDVRRATDPALPPAFPSVSLGSVAYLAAEDGRDRLYVQEAVPGAEPVAVATFLPAFGLHARGTVSPDGTRVLVVHPGQLPGAGSVALVQLPSALVSDLSTAVDYLSNFAWSADSEHVAMARSSVPDAVGRVQVEIFELNLASLAERPVTRTGPVFEAAPVGYSGAALYFVTVDQSGSGLFVTRNGRTEKVAQLSVGRTRGWVLHPDGARLAYLDVIGAGAARAVVAKVMLLTTGETTTLPGEDDHAGIAWRFNADLPDVGGPGGSLQLQGAATGAETVFPSAWDPQGQRLLATVVPGRTGEAAGGALEIISVGGRLALAEGDVTPLGWVAGVG